MSTDLYTCDLLNICKRLRPKKKYTESCVKPSLFFYSFIIEHNMVSEEK